MIGVRAFAAVVIALILGSAAHSQHAPAMHPKYGSLNCLYDRLTPAQRSRVDLDAIDSQANLRLLEGPTQACADKGGWPAELYLVVIEHFNARIGFERAEALMVRAGAQRGDIEKAYNAVGKAERNELRNGGPAVGAALRKAAPDLVRFGTPVVNALSNYAEMKAMENAWASIDPNG